MIRHAPQRSATERSWLPARLHSAVGIVAACVGAALAVTACQGPSASATSAFPATTEEALLTLAPMLERTAPAVVNISVEIDVEQDLPLILRDPAVRRFFDLPDDLPTERQITAGSGVIIDADSGHIVTNHHVIAGAESIWVTLRDGRSFQAELLGSDPPTDIAVLRIDSGGLSELAVADSDAVQVGDFAVAIGNPFGLGQSVTTGIVSGLGRAGLLRDGYEDFIQTDASINPGNSGGALVNSRGELIGINTAILSRNGGNIGISFAVPSNIARDVAQRLLQSGEIQRGNLGVTITDISPGQALELGLGTTNGAIVAAVANGSAAAAAGLEAGDVIVAVDGRAIVSAAALRSRVGLLRIGDKIELTVIRDGVERQVAAEVGQPI